MDRPVVGALYWAGEVMKDSHSDAASGPRSRPSGRAAKDGVSPVPASIAIAEAAEIAALPFDNPICCRQCGSIHTKTAHHAIREPGAFGKMVIVSEWLARSCIRCGAEWRVSLAEAAAGIDNLSAVVDAARAYRTAESDDTPRMWRGKALQDLANDLDDRIAALDDAQGMEAGTGETACGLDAKRDSPVGNADAPAPSDESGCPAGVSIERANPARLHGAAKS
jgi:transcription elongation factor Elf1